MVDPITKNVVSKEAYDKNNIKAKRITLDVIKDHVIPHITRKDNVHDMWDALTILYQSSNENRNMVLREKLKRIKTIKVEKSYIISC